MVRYSCPCNKLVNCTFKIYNTHYVALGLVFCILCWYLMSSTGRESGDNDFDLRVVVITFNRANSLKRLLDSLNKAEYAGDGVKVEIWIDRSQTGVIHEPTVDVAKNFQFFHGSSEVIIRPVHAGLYGQWLTTWHPMLTTTEIAVILEDDITVSPYFYKYLKTAHKKYDSFPDINGYSLQGVSIKHGTGTGKLDIPKHNIAFRYPVLGTWGFSPSVANWIKFTTWIANTRTNSTFNPYIPGNIVTEWYKGHQQQRKTDNMWSIWHAYFAWKSKEYTLYCNFGKFKI